MVLSNYKCMHIQIQDPEILIQGLQTYSSNYKYIPVMFLRIELRSMQFY